MPLSQSRLNAISLSLLALTGIAVALGFFHAFPAMDIAASKLFCHPAVTGDPADLGRICESFPARDNPLLALVRKILFYLPPAAVAALALDILYRHLTTAFGQCRGFRSELIAISAYLLGPIAVVNWILKEYSGRPRPVQTFLFGGAMDFHAAGDFGGACMSNCSFVSGEAAAAGWLLCLIPLVRRFDRPALVWLLVGASAITPFLRLAMGGHYLSDVILGWLAGAISYPVIVLLNGLVRRHGSALIKSHT